MSIVEKTPAIRIEKLTVSLADRQIIKDLSLEVREGEILGVVGASGGGKSVLLRTILGLIRKSQGTIEVLGVDVDTASDQDKHSLGRRCGTLFQQGALFSGLTVLQNVEFPMREYLVLPDELRREVSLAKLEMVGLTANDAKKFPAELSGGMTKRVALARALALDPEIVFLDEPTSGLDPIAAEEFDVLIRTLQQTLGLTVYMNTHDLDTLNSVCDRIAALADGKIAAIGSMAEMQACQHPWIQHYFCGRRAHLAVRSPHQA